MFTRRDFLGWSAGSGALVRAAGRRQPIEACMGCAVHVTVVS